MTQTRTRLERGRGVLGPALELVHTGQAPTRALLTAELGVTRATAGAVAAELAALGLITVDSRPSASVGTQGRPSHRLAVAPDGPVALAAQVHADGFRAALVGLGGQVLASVPGCGTVAADPAQVLGEVVDAGAELLRQSGRRCVGAGLAVPSAVAEPEGTALNPLHLAWEAGARVREVFVRELERAGIEGPSGPSATPPSSESAAETLSGGSAAAPSGGSAAGFVANDLNVAALAEHRHGAGRAARHLLVVGTGHRGVGGALVLDGRLHTGSSGLAMEVGHLTVDPEGRACHCGGRGCLDVETDPLALLEAAGRTPGPESSLLDQAQELVRAEYATDPAVRGAVHTLVDRLGFGLAGLVNILNPDRVVLAGLHRLLVEIDGERLCSVVTRRSLWGRSGSVPIAASSLAHSSLVGAAELAWQPVLDDPLGTLGG